MQLIEDYFELSEEQKTQFSKLDELYKEWNAQINVISRKDQDNFYERHVLHSLAIACVVDFKDGTRILDVGTGGGFPGIPLAILFPECRFVLLDSIGKKIKVVQAVVEALGLKNVEAIHGRAEKEKRKFDFIISRAVTRMGGFIPWVQKNIAQDQQNALPNGILYLKGGDLEEEMSEINYDYDIYDIAEFFQEPFFDTKKVVYVRMV